MAYFCRMKNTLFYLPFLWLCLTAHGQKKLEHIQIGLFTSLYLDQSFDQDNVLLSSTSFPRQSIAGLEFYEGASLAIDSLNAEGKKCRMKVYDVQSRQGNISMALEQGDFDHMDLIIAQVGGNEFLQLAVIAREFDIPLVNATYPNDRGIRESPKLFMANPRINTHINVLHQNLSALWPTSNIIWLRRKQVSEEKLELIFRENNMMKSNIFLKYKQLVIDDSNGIEEIFKKLDSNRNNVVVVGSIDEDFAEQALKSLSLFSRKGLLHIIGMPNWESLRSLQSKQFSDLPIYYTSSYYVPHMHPFSSYLDEKFKANTGVKVSSFALKGYQLTYHFAKTLSTGPIESITQPFKPLIYEMDFKPVINNMGTRGIDYYENKKINFLRRLNGITTLVQ